MIVLFIIASDVAVAATLLAITSRVTLHALLYLAISLLAVAMVFYSLGAAFVAALEVIIYAGAIVVLFLFAVMLLSPQERMVEEGGARPRRRAWAGPALLALVLLGEMVYAMLSGPEVDVATTPISPQQVGVTLFTPYALAVELASMLLLAALIGVRHLAGRSWTAGSPEAEEADES